MPKICYVAKSFNTDHATIIVRANRIIESYREQGYDLTLRQLYYQFIARDLFPDTWIDEEYNRREGLGEATKNTIKNYKRLGVIISDGRRAGQIDWEAIVDRTRNLRAVATWEHPREIVATCARQFTVDMWKLQKYRPEVWVEKDALLGVMDAACEKWHVPYFSCRGYTSDSEMWSAAQRLDAAFKVEGKTPVVFSLGDHDPSGVDMSRDIQDRLAMFSTFVNCPVEVRRIALTMEQVQEVDPPPNPAKETDSRFKGYQEAYGDDSWELDALEPQYLTELIGRHLQGLIEPVAWAEAERVRDEARRLLGEVAKKWDRITTKL